MTNTQPSSEFFVGWGTLALINAGLAWFVASIFLGPLATLVLVLVEKKSPASE